jgi:trehalose 6-phosphate synthase
MPRRILRMDEVVNELSDIDFYCISNRGPVRYVKRGSGENRYIAEESTIGGLSRVLNSTMRKTGGTWVAWGSGPADREYVALNCLEGKTNTIKVPREDPKYELEMVWLTENEVANHYNGFCNRTAWPLGHEIHDKPPVFDRPEYWRAFRNVNSKFGRTVPEEGRYLAWVHDYHNMLAPRIMKGINPDGVITFFWHIPWPTRERFGRCPQREELLEGLVCSDIMGLHTDGHCENFLNTVDRYTDHNVNHDNGTITHDCKLTRVRKYPIGIDFEWFDRTARACTNTDEIHTGKLSFLSVNRLDYTKGLKETIQAIERLLERHPDEYRGNIVFSLVAASSRSNVVEYRETKKEFGEMAGRVNQRFQIGDWKPIEFFFEPKTHEELAAYYRRADGLLALPRHDGMNVTPKEYAASQVDEKGVLIVSEFAGVVEEVGRDSLVVNPFDTNAVADAIHKAATMERREKRARMKRIRRQARENDSEFWMRKIMTDALNLYHGGDL